jgi:hypothetical protein
MQQDQKTGFLERQASGQRPQALGGHFARFIQGGIKSGQEKVLQHFYIGVLEHIRVNFNRCTALVAGDGYFDHASPGGRRDGFLGQLSLGLGQLLF